MSNLIINNKKLKKKNSCSICSKNFSKPSHLRCHQSIHTSLKRFECTDCNKWFKLESSLKRHQTQTHRVEKKHKCLQCKASFAQNSNLKIHTERLHPNGKHKKRKFSCQQCNCIFTCQSALNKHKKIRHKFSEKFGEDDIEDPSKFAQYVVEQLKTLEQNIPSTSSNVSNVNSEQEITIIEKVKVEQSVIIDKLNPEKYEKSIVVQTVKRPLKRLAYVCEYCAKEFYKTYNLIRHLRTHTEFRPYPCKYCISCFTTKTQLETHMNRNHKLDEKTGILSHCHNCLICNKNFRSLRKLDLHIKTHSSSLPVQYKCSICEVCFKTKSSFSSHNHKKIDKELKMLKSLLPEPSIEPSDINNPFYNCNHCGLHFLKNINLQRHKKQHISNQKYKCKICGRSYASSLSLRVHHRVHEPLKTFECNLCTNRKFNTKWLLENHIKYVHENLRNVKCVYCPKTFKSKSNCKSHMATHLKRLLGNEKDNSINLTNSQEATIIVQGKVENISKNKFNSITQSSVTDSTSLSSNTCIICSKTFNKIHDLSRHLRIHSNERPFACDSCKKSFKLKSTLEYHLNTHLKPTERKKITCQVCGKSFAAAKSLTVHLRRHTETVPYGCDVYGS